MVGNILVDILVVLALTNLRKEKSVEFRILLPAGEIPDGEVVTKRTGEKEYILKHKVEIFGLPGPMVFESNDDVVFLSDMELGKFNAVSRDTLLMWKLEEEDMLSWLHDRDMERQAK